MTSEWWPCHFHDYSDFLPEEELGFRYGVTFEGDASTQRRLESHAYMGGGYSWHGIVESMIRERQPALNAELEYAPEASMLSVRSSNREALSTVVECIRTAVMDESVLHRAIDSADQAIME